MRNGYPPPAILTILPFRGVGIAPGFFLWMGLVELAAWGIAWRELASCAEPVRSRSIGGAAGILGALLLRIRRRGGKSHVSDAFLSLAIVPVVPPLGWCHAYAYTIPAVAWCLWSETSGLRLVVAVAVLAFRVPGYLVLPLGLLPAVPRNAGSTRFLIVPGALASFTF